MTIIKLFTSHFIQKPLRSVDSFVCTQFIPLKSNYTQLNAKMPFQKLNNVNNALNSNQNSPKYVQSLEQYVLYVELQRHNCRLFRCFFLRDYSISTSVQQSTSNADNSKSTVIINDSGKRVTIDSNVLLEIIPSDIDPNRVLKTPSRNSCWL